MSDGCALWCECGRFAKGYASGRSHRIPNGISGPLANSGRANDYGAEGPMRERPVARRRRARECTRRALPGQEGRGKAKNKQELSHSLRGPAPGLRLPPRGTKRDLGGANLCPPGFPSRMSPDLAARVDQHRPEHPTAHLGRRVRNPTRRTAALTNARKREETEDKEGSNEFVG